MVIRILFPFGIFWLERDNFRDKINRLKLSIPSPTPTFLK